MHQLVRSEKLKFVFSGVLINGISFLLYLFFVWLGVSPKISLSFLYWVAVVYTFFINRSFVFNHEGKLLFSFVKHLSVYAVGYLISISIMTFALDWMALNHLYSMAFASVVMPIYFYLMQKHLVFK